MVAEIIFASVMCLMVIVLGFLYSNEDFQIWFVCKVDPEFKKFYEENKIERLRLEYRNRNNEKWGS